MKKLFLTAACMAAIAATTTMCSKSSEVKDNPFLTEYETPYQIPPFDKIKFEHYIPAMEAGFEEQNKNVEAIIANPDTTFANTILAFEESSPILDRVSYVMYALTESDACPELDSISEIFFPAVTQHSDEIWMNDALFQRVKALYDSRDTLPAVDQRRLVEEYYKRFTRAGALLSPEQKAELKEINTELQNLYLQFNKNLLDATNAYAYIVTDSAMLSGLPKSSVDQAAEAAAEMGKEGSWAFTLHAPSRLPLLH